MVEGYSGRSCGCVARRSRARGLTLRLICGSFEVFTAISFRLVRALSADALRAAAAAAAACLGPRYLTSTEFRRRRRRRMPWPTLAYCN